jgi:regulatory protein
MEYAVYYISRFPKTAYELRLKLLEKGYYEREADETIKRLKSQDYINDKKFADMYLQSEVIRKGKPLWTITSKLKQKGVAGHIIHELVQTYEGDIQEGVIAGIRKQIGKYKEKGVEGFDIAQKLVRK